MLLQEGRLLKMKKKILLLACFLSIILMIPKTVSANIGPNPSTIIDFIGFEGELYYVALLSEEPGWGYGDYVSESNVEELKENERVEHSDSNLAFIRFATYYDKDNFHLIGSGIKDCSNKHNYTYTWAYNVPEEFKILIYFPETNKIISSDVLEHYAFDSFFKVEFLGSTIVFNKTRTPLDEITSISVRIFLILLIELATAWLFKFRQKNQIRFITVFTIVTQLVYSISLLIIEYKLEIGRASCRERV